MKRMLGFVGVTLLAAAAMLVGRIGTTQATGDNVMYVELFKSLNETCGPVGSAKVEIIEDGTTTTRYTDLNGIATYTVATPSNGEVLTIKYYKYDGTLGGQTTATINPGGITSDPWIFGEGVNGSPCDNWVSARTVHRVYSPN